MADANKKRVGLYLSEGLVKKLDKIADKQERSRNWIVEKLLGKAVECEESEKEIACS